MISYGVYPMAMVNSFVDVIDALGGTSRFAAAVGMEANTAKMARARRSISPRWWGAVADAAREAGRKDITLEKLAELAVQKHAPEPERAA